MLVDDVASESDLSTGAVTLSPSQRT